MSRIELWTGTQSLTQEDVIFSLSLPRVRVAEGPQILKFMRNDQVLVM